MTSGTRRALRRYGVYFLAWTVVGLFYFSRNLTQRLLWHDAVPWQSTLRAWMVGAYISAALTPMVLWLGSRWPLERRTWRRHALVHLCFSALFSTIQLALETVAFVRLEEMGLLHTGQSDRTFAGRFPALLVLGFHGNIIAYWAILALQSVFRYYRRYQEREQHALRLELQAAELKTQVVRAQLSALKMQLQPHFLFNTLNAIIVLVRQQRTREAEDMLARLSDLLRIVLADVEAQEVPLRRELEYLTLYLAIQQIRFSDRLRVDVDVADDLLDAAIPPMGLQPIVENAVRHGVGQRAAAGRIQISAARTNGSLEITVRDDGPGFREEAGGIGLANTRARLAQLYGTAAALITGNSDQGGAVVTMVLPYHLAEASRLAREGLPREG